MTKKKIFHVKPQINDNDEVTIQGFDIEIDKNDIERIDRLVNDYESRIMNHLDELYIQKTKKSDRFADKIAYFGGSWKFIIWFTIFLALWTIWNSYSGPKELDIT